MAAAVPSLFTDLPSLLELPSCEREKRTTCFGISSVLTGALSVSGVLSLGFLRIWVRVGLTLYSRLLVQSAV